MRYKPIWFFLFIGVLLPILVDFSSINVHTETFLANMSYAKETNHFIYFSHSIFIFLAFLTPLLATLSVIVIIFQESNAESWKYYFVSPFSFAEVIISKIFASILLIIILFIIITITHLLSASAISAICPDLGIVIEVKTFLIFFYFSFRIAMAGLAIIPLIWLAAFFSQSYFLITVISSIFLIFISFSINPYTYPFEESKALLEMRKTLNTSLKDSILSYRLTLQNLRNILYLIFGWFALIILKEKVKKRIYKL